MRVWRKCFVAPFLSACMPNFFLELVPIYSWKDNHKNPFSTSPVVEFTGSRSQHSCQEMYFPELWSFAEYIIEACNLKTSMSLLSALLFDKLITVNSLTRWTARMLILLGVRQLGRPWNIFQQWRLLKYLIPLFKKTLLGSDIITIKYLKNWSPSDPKYLFLITCF